MWRVKDVEVDERKPGERLWKTLWTPQLNVEDL